MSIVGLVVYQTDCRQDTDFRYLTGCLQPDNVLVIGIDWKQHLA